MRQDEEKNEHIDEIKKYEEDLYSEEEEIEASFFEYEEPKKKRNPWIRRSILLVLALVMAVNVISFLPQFFNIPALEFVKKSRELSQQEDIQAYKKAVVVIKSEDRKGTGFNITPDGLIITNHHIIEDEDTAIVSFPDGSTFQGRVVNKIEEIDTAWLQIEGEELPFLNITSEQNWEKGDPIYFIGNPLAFTQIANEGVIEGEIIPQNWIKPAYLIEAPVYKGNSGSPVINEDGEVIAVIFAKTSVRTDEGTKRYGLAIPTSYFYNEL